MNNFTVSFKLFEWLHSHNRFSYRNIITVSNTQVFHGFDSAAPQGLYIFVHSFTFTTSVPFSNALIPYWFFMHIRSKHTSFTTKLRFIFRTQSNIYDEAFCKKNKWVFNHFHKKLHLRCTTWFWIRLWNSLLHIAYWNFYF